MASIGPDRRLAAYRRLSRILVPRGYAGKIMLLAFVAAHVPLLALVAYLLLATDLGHSETLAVLLVGVAATVAGTGVALAGLWVLLAPVASASRTLRAYRLGGAWPALPTDVEGEGGQLLADVHQTLAHLDEAISRLEELSARDGLTGVLNRRAGEQRLEEDLDAVRHGGQGLALLALDADCLKDVNDRWGHGVGDAYLRHLAATIQRHVGEGGWVARWGGDEFVAVLREAEGAPSAETVLRRISEDLAVASVVLAANEQIRPGVSGGVARAQGNDDPAGLVERADAALYRAKRAGSNADRGRDRLARGEANPSPC